MTKPFFTRRANWRERSCPVPHCKAYVWGDVTVFVGQEPQIGWHISISNPHRYPTWDEIKRARYDLVPHDVTMAMLLPPPEDYVNIHNNCFHLHQIPNDFEIGLRPIAI